MAEPVVINMAAGADQSIDARIAPNGTVSRAENLRLDKLGRLVQRSGYTALGMRVAKNSSPLVPIDLYDLDGRLLAIGRHGDTEPGPRLIYEQTTGPDFDWWFLDNGDPNPGSSHFEALLPLTRAPEAIYADPSAGASSEHNVADVAVSASGYVCHVQGNSDPTLPSRVSAIIFDPSGAPINRQQFVQFGNPRVIAVGDTFVLFHQNQATANITVRNFTAGVSTSWPAQVTIVTNASPNSTAAYSVTPITGNTTHYVIVWPTAAGYTWERKDLSHATLATATVAGVSGGAVDVEANQSENAIWVVNKVAGNGANIQRWTLTGAASAGPFNSDPFGAPIDAVYIKRGSASNICIVLQELSGSFRGAFVGLVRDTLALNIGPSPWTHMRAAGRPGVVNDDIYGVVQMAVTGSSGSQAMGLFRYGLNNQAVNQPLMHAFMKQGQGCPVPAQLINWKATTKLAMGDRQQFAEVMSLDTRSNTTRNTVYRFTIGDENRRQAAVLNGSLYLSGGALSMFAGDLPVRPGFAHAPVIFQLTAGVGGGLTLLGTYQYVAVYRTVLQDGRVIQSAPSDVVTITLTGGNNRVTATVVRPQDSTLVRWYVLANVVVWIDLYRTEDGGSIPRLVSSTELGLVTTALGGPSSIVDDATDAAQQTGNTVYTQGADGVVSGRLPLNTAEGCEVIAEAGGRLIMGRVENPNELEISHANRPGEAVGFSEDDLFFLTSPERVVGVAADGQRKIVFTGKRTYEVVGEGPNQAGIGEISDPMELDPTVGCRDWRSICSTEQGVFFQPSGERPGYCLLPSAGGRAIDVGREIEQTLSEFPVIVAATRHVDQDLLTLCLQNTDGTDSRLAHLDMRQSGLGARGWRGRWFVDRVPLLEGERAPEVVASSNHDFGMVAISASQLINIPLPEGRQLNDRIIIIMHTQGVQNTTPSGYSLLANFFTSSGVSIFRVYERILTTAAAVLSSVASTFPSGGISSAMSFRVFLIRNGDPAQASQLTHAAVTTSAPTCPLLTPAWGTAKNLWLAAVAVDSAQPASLANVANNNLSQLTAAPAGFGNAESTVIYGGANLATDTGELATAWKQERAANGQFTWSLRASNTTSACLIAVKPLAVSGGPVRTAVASRQQLYLANATTVYRADADASTDQGGAQIAPVWEAATIYPMGPGGAGRHVGVTFVGELLGFCALTCSFSYDDGRTWKTGRTHHLSPANGYQLGQTVRVHWTPARRKIEGVRVRIEWTSEDGISSPATGTTRGVAGNQVTLWFEGLLGKSRLAQSRSF